MDRFIHFIACLSVVARAPSGVRSDAESVALNVRPFTRRHSEVLGFHSRLDERKVTLCSIKMSAVHETSAEGSPKAEPVQGIGDQNDTEAARSDVVASSPPYSTFTKLEKGWIVFLVALAGVFSPLSSFIYYPAINSIANDLHVSIEKINLTITSYMVVSGIAPSIIGDIADMFGRRPAYILLLTVYLVANISLALQNSYPALLVLRMLQSFGSSGEIRTDIILFCLNIKR
ncbi:MAG: hypothetical protein M1837_000386 [Sclerophora amabilis]|nr:MAG: hypothetical protein M1837_000386 [Sclerophora amabilis]